MAFYIIAVVFIVIWIIYRSKRHVNIPPGPPKIPILGSIPFLKLDKEISIFSANQDLHKRYGDIVSYYVGSQPIILVNDFTILRELYSKDTVNSRPAMQPTNTFRYGYNDPIYKNVAPGVGWINGKIWHEQRQFMVKNLREFGFGKNAMEGALLEEATKLCKELQKSENIPMKLDGIFNIAIINALWRLMVNETLEINDPRATQLVEAVNGVMQKSNVFFSPLLFLLPDPRMVKLPGLWELAKFDIAKTSFDILTSEMESKVTEHLQTIDYNSPRDFLDTYLTKVANTSDQQSSFFEERGKTFAINNLVDMFLGGMETTATSLLWTVLYLIHHTEVQDIMYEEIQQVIGSERLPTMADEHNMPYTCAVIHESHRKSGLAHMGAGRETSTDINISKYVIPKGAICIPNLHAIMHDPDNFTNPYIFNPERFINRKGEFHHHERVIPFSIGKRSCLGQSLAEREFFLFLVMLVQQFKLKTNPNTELPPYNDIALAVPTGVVKNPPEFDVILTSR